MDTEERLKELERVFVKDTKFKKFIEKVVREETKKGIKRLTKERG